MVSEGQIVNGAISSEAEDRLLAVSMIDRLNTLIENEECRRAIGMLCQVRVTVSDLDRGLRDSSTLQVGAVGSSFAELGVLGLINGMIGVRSSDGWGYVAAVFADGDEPEQEPGALMRFEVSKGARS